MKFHEFAEKLKEIQEEYYKTYNRKLETIEELEQFIALKKRRTSGRRHLKSLKGLGF
jgi:CMP-2-keto-3-deoxyoctulosonic acid synthetase